MPEDIAVTKFREYLRINTEHPTPNYYGCQAFLYALADELGIARTSHEMVPGKPIVIMSIPGTEPDLPSIMLYSHTDVVPTFREHWKYDPYSAHKDEQGRIYGRGTQDMKCVGSQYFEAIRRHFGRGKKQFRRTVYMVWSPDEEIGGDDGMGKFVESDEFSKVNLGFALDEGLASENEVYKVYYGQRCEWWIHITFTGNPGHGSKFIENTAFEKLHKFMTAALAFRAEQKAKLDANPEMKLGDVTSLNITVIQCGVQTNVVPEKIVANVDLRLTPSEDFDDMETKIREWCDAAGEGITIDYQVKAMSKSVTPTARDDPWWAAFEDALNDECCPFSKKILIGATDSAFLRATGLRSIGFSPMINMPSLLHDHNDDSKPFLSEECFLRGVEIYETLIEKLADLHGSSSNEQK